jgi:CheY-like chemotaxis protein
LDHASDRPSLLLVANDANTLWERLRVEGCDVFAAGPGERAIEAVSRARIDCLIFDLSASGRHGFDVCGELRASGSDISIVFLTSRNRPMDGVIGLRRGADDYVRKPVALEERAFSQGSDIQNPVDEDSAGGVFQRIGRKRGVKMRSLSIGLLCLFLTISVEAQRRRPGGGNNNTPAAGEPLAGLTTAQRTAFDDGLEDFTEVEGVDDGLGPVFTSAPAPRVTPRR